VSIIKSTLVGRLAVPSAQDVSVDGPNRPLEPNPPLVHSRVLPEFACGFERVDTDGLPPCALVAGAMDCAVMGAAQRYSEFVARPAAERVVREYDYESVHGQRRPRRDFSWIGCLGMTPKGSECHVAEAPAWPRLTRRFEV
jgi:hypothetical protein